MEQNIHFGNDPNLQNFIILISNKEEHDLVKSLGLNIANLKNFPVYYRSGYNPHVSISNDAWAVSNYGKVKESFGNPNEVTIDYLKQLTSPEYTIW